MKSGINLELKYFCADFAVIRRELKMLGAKRVVIKTQKDYFFELPPYAGVMPRMKLRIEKDKQKLIYYRRPDFSAKKVVAATLLIYSITDKKLLPFLRHALGVKSIVEKKRELWKKGTTVFHLDRVKHIGNVFEIELQKKGKITEKDKKTFAAYQNIFIPHLGKIIKGSNGDLRVK